MMDRHSGYSGGREREDCSSRPIQSKKLVRPHFNQISQVCESHKEEDNRTVWPEQKPKTLFEKYLMQKRARGITLVVECLASMRPCIQTPVPPKKKKKAH
jgi:hypothetical protein